MWAVVWHLAAWQKARQRPRRDDTPPTRLLREHADQRPLLFIVGTTGTRRARTGALNLRFTR